MTLNWAAFAAGSGNGTGEGYMVIASSTNFNGLGTVYSSSTFVTALSTLTVDNLENAVLYYFRGGAINHNGVVNYSFIGSATTGAGAAPAFPVISRVQLSSITVSWISVGSLSGYIVDASTASDFTGTLTSSTTADGSATTLTVQSLFANTTYYLRAGAIYSGTTNYENTVPPSTSTLAILRPRPDGARLAALGPYARGTIVGLTRGNGRAHLARAALESIAYQTVDAVRAMEAASGVGLEELKADGGATVNRWLMQFQADVLGVPVVVPEMSETTALGAAYLAGVAVGAVERGGCSRDVARGRSLRAADVGGRARNAALGVADGDGRNQVEPIG